MNSEITKNFLTTIAWLLITVPIVFASIFGLLQLLNGDILGVENLVLIIPLATIAVIARKKPFTAGSILIIVATSLAITYPLLLKEINTTTLVLTELFFFAPPLTAGLILVALNHGKR